VPPRFIGPQVFRPQVRIPIQALVSRPPPPLRAPGGQPGFRPVPGGQQGFRPVPGGQPGFRPVRGGQPGFRPTTVAPNPTIRPSLRIASPTSKFHFYRSYFHFYHSYIQLLSFIHSLLSILLSLLSILHSLLSILHSLCMYICRPYGSYEDQLTSGNRIEDWPSYAAQ
jgi:hypothetical protein